MQYLCNRISSNADKIYAVSVAGTVWQIVPRNTKIRFQKISQSTLSVFLLLNESIQKQARKSGIQLENNSITYPR